MNGPVWHLPCFDIALFAALYLWITMRGAIGPADLTAEGPSRTVRNHLSVAIQKLGGRNRVEAARVAEDKGWL